MSIILTFNFQKRKQLNILEEYYLNYTKKEQFTFSLKQGKQKQAMDPFLWICMGWKKGRDFLALKVATL